MGFTNFIIENFNEFLTYTGFANVTAGNLIMIVVGAFFIWLARSALMPDWRLDCMRTTPCLTSSIRVCGKDGIHR